MLLGKLVLFFALVSVLYLSEAFFEGLFSLSLWRPLFVSDGPQPMGLWWLHWWSHRYAAGVGMAVGLAVAWLRAEGVLTDATGSETLFPRPLSW